MIDDATDTTTTVDAFLGGALLLRQPKRGYRAGIDPILLAARCKARLGARVLDCGSGIGTVGLCIARRIPGCEVVLVERNETYCRLAAENITLNHLSDHVRLVRADLTAPLTQSIELDALKGTFDHALANPPYQVSTTGTRSPDSRKDAANAMPEDSLDDWARYLAAMLKPAGQMAMIHRADALARVLAVLDGRFGALSVLPLHPSLDRPANRIIITGQKGSRAPLTLLQGLIVHRPDGGYSAQIEAVLRTPAALATN